MNRVHLFAFSIFLLLINIGCATTPFREGDSWDPKEDAFFDDGVDVFADYTAISGQWAYRQEKALDGRLQLADFVGVVDISAVQTQSDFEVEAAKRIDADIVEIIYGEAPSQSIQLVSTREAPGHQLLLRYEQRLVGNKYLAFIRWFKNDDKTLGHHFHLSPASDYLLEKVRLGIDKRKRLEAVAH